MIRFITLSNERSGSSFFQRLLDNHPNIRARQENMRRPMDQNNKNINRLLGTSNKELKAVGFKVQYRQVYCGMMKYCKKKNIKIIQLIRRNLLETILFNNRLRLLKGEYGQLGVYWEWKRPLEVINIDNVIKEINKLYKNIEKYRKYADYTVYYEDFTGNKDCSDFYDKKKRRELFSFLNVLDKNVKVDREINRKNKRPQLVIALRDSKKLIQELEKQKINWYYNE